MNKDAVQHERGPRKPKVSKEGFLTHSQSNFGFPHHTKPSSLMFGGSPPLMFHKTFPGHSHLSPLSPLTSSPSLFSSQSSSFHSFLSTVDRNRNLWSLRSGVSESGGSLALPPPPPLLSSHLPPVLPLSSIPTFPTSWENLQETAARLLFMAVRWAKCLAPFQTLSEGDQVSCSHSLTISYSPSPCRCCCCRSAGRTCSCCTSASGR